METIERILNDREIRFALKLAWTDSNAGLANRHEEGGFVLRSPEGTLKVVRWPLGIQDRIEVPSHDSCRFDGQEIVASFHTHPNTSGEYLQGPSATDKRAVRNDPHLKGSDYVGELVISARVLYLVDPDGNVFQLGHTAEILA